jgi:hypothetical protein
MARRDKEPAQEQESEWMPTGEDSLLLRSAESLGRVIGSLQRELDNAARHLFKADGHGRRDGNARNGNGRDGKGTTSGKGKTVRRRATGTTAAASRTAAAASKTAPARKTARKPAARKATKRKK